MKTYPQEQVDIYANVTETRRILGFSICNINMFYGEQYNPYMKITTPVVIFNGNRLFNLPKIVTYC